MLINHELTNIISYYDGMFICTCRMCNPPMSCDANVLSQFLAAVRFRLDLTDRIAKKLSVGYILGRALKVSGGYFFKDLSLVC